MHIRHAKGKGEQGNVILICVMFSLVLGITIASYLVVVRSQYIATTRSYNWNAAMVLAEAGVEDAMALINKNVGDFSNLTNWPATASMDGWSSVGGNVFHVQRTSDSSLGYYDVWVTNLNDTVSILSAGTATWDVTNPDPTGGGNVRQLVVKAGLDPLFSVVVGVVGDLNMAGNPFLSDSFDSTDPSNSSWGPNSTFGVYDPTKQGADGNIAANGTIFNVLSPSAAQIYGMVQTGPGGATNLAQNGSVGDLTWGQPGIQPGHSSDDMNVDFPAVQLPVANYYILNTATTNNSPITITNGGYYQVIDNYGLEQSLTVNATNGNVILYLVHGLNYIGQGGSGYGGPGGPGGGGGGGHRLRVTTNSSLTIYAGEQFYMDKYSGVRVTNAANFFLYGLTNLTTIHVEGATNFTGCIYAPQADLSIGEDSFGEYEHYHMIGSFITRSVTNLDAADFHYDEGLRHVGSGPSGPGASGPGGNIPARAFVATNWTEL